jgi:uncharacterized protein (TIGR02444 family)
MAPLPPTETPLWAFSLAVYGRDGVADECLKLQERLSLDVNLLLFGAFIGTVEGLIFEAQDIVAANHAVSNWHCEIVRALRGARRALKSVNADVRNPLHETTVALRTQVKGNELEAEKIEQAMLWQWSRRQLAGRPRSDRDQALTENLRGILDFYRAAGDPLAATARLRGAAAAYARATL